MRQMKSSYSPLSNFNDQPLVKKKASPTTDHHSTILRTIIKTHENQYQQSKPFNKKYGHQSKTSKLSNHSPNILLEQKKSSTKVGLNDEGYKRLQKGPKKQTFHQRLSNNIIKDQQLQNGEGPKESYRIKKVQNISPKKSRDELINLNQEQYKQQQYILDYHNKHKSRIDKVIEFYKIGKRNIGQLLGETKQIQTKDSRLSKDCDQSIELRAIDSLINAKMKSFHHQEKLISNNSYLKYLLSPSLINQISQSEEEDEIVDELPQRNLPLQSNLGSYTQAMTGIRSKNYALNLRRTYDVFKEGGGDKKDKLFIYIDRKTSDLQGLEEDHKGQNIMKVNNKLKDFLLN